MHSAAPYVGHCTAGASWQGARLQQERGSWGETERCSVAVSYWVALGRFYPSLDLHVSALKMEQLNEVVCSQGLLDRLETF